MKLEDALTRMATKYPLTTCGRFIECPDGINGFDTIADCRDEDQAVILTHTFNNFLPVVGHFEAVANFLGALMRDIELPEEANSRICSVLDDVNEHLARLKQVEIP